MSLNPPGYTGVFRYSDEFPQSVTPWWDAEDDVEDIGGELRYLVDRELTSPRAVVFVAHLDDGCPDYRVRAAVLLLPSPPWPTENNQAWVVFWEGDSEVNVVEHPDRDSAVEAFFAHVSLCEAEGEMYDYVVNPQKPQTAMPPHRRPRSD